MVKKIRLLGMVIDNFPLREEVQMGENFYNKMELNIIRTVSMKMFSMAADSQAVRDGMMQADLLVVGDKEILTEAGIYSSQRLKEAVEHGFMKEFLGRMSMSGRSVFLVASDSHELNLFRDYLKAMYENMRIVGCYALDGSGSAYDSMINEINAAAPDTLLSVMESPQEDEFLLKAKAKISAKVWYSLGVQYRSQQEKPSFLLRFLQLVHKGKFKNIVHNYENEEKQEDRNE